MSKDIFLPNYKDSILGIPNSILAHYGANPHHATLPVLDERLNKGYKNIVLLVLGGMGLDVLKAHAPDGFLMKNCAAQISSVYPCTTTSALTTFETGLTPMEHGWLGWSQYFNEINKCVDLFSNKESGTERPAAEHNIVWEAIGFKNLFAQIQEVDSTIECCRVSPFGEYWSDTNEAVCNHLEMLCKKDGRRYIYCYHFQPDMDMHDHGCYNERVKADIVLFDKQIEQLAANLNDTLLIVTADHGLTDTKRLCMEDYPEIWDCLSAPPTREPRSLAIGFEDNTADVRIAQYESGTRTPKEDTLQKIAEVLDVNYRSIYEPTLYAAEDVMYTLFELDEHYGIKIFGDPLDDDPDQNLSVNFGSNLINDFLKEWKLRKKELVNGVISKEEYIEWKLNWPQTADDCGKFEAKKNWRKED